MRETKKKKKKKEQTIKASTKSRIFQTRFCQIEAHISVAAGFFFLHTSDAANYTKTEKKGLGEKNRKQKKTVNDNTHQKKKSEARKKKSKEKSGSYI